MPSRSAEASAWARLSQQIRLMEERLIIVDNDDNPLGDGSKKECAFLHRCGRCRASQAIS